LVLGTTSVSAEETRLSVPDGDDRGPLTPMAESEGDWSRKRLAGESVDSGSSSVIGTSSHSIEPHPDDETERRVFSRRRYPNLIGGALDRVDVSEVTAENARSRPAGTSEAV